ncbi:uncharacterized protein LOC143210270 [Lasioglossum baleicum]|uniref:uncharacterized protein LOC143210270 n=1 Tax=Lasioglossum baleicum TaxID=434251 RepID=UPI003FCD95C9
MNFFGPYMRCPFDESHRILDGRLQKHLVKCRKNYPKDTKLHCYYNATHVLNVDEYEHHISTCPSSGNIKCFQTTIGEEQKVGTVPLEELCKVQTDIVCDEDWSGGNVTYNPIAASEKKNVMRSVVGLSKAKKSQFKQYERERIAMIEKKENNTIDNKSVSKKLELEEPLRKPKNAAKAISLDKTLGDKDDKEAYLGHLVSKMKEVDLKKDSTLLQKNVSITNNRSSGENSKENSANNSLSENSSLRGGLESISKKKLNMTRNDVKRYEKPKETDAKNNSIHQHLDKEINRRVNTKITMDTARKISTGRGFTILYEKVKNDTLQSEGDNTNLDHYRSNFGYGEDKNDDNDGTSQVK